MRVSTILLLALTGTGLMAARSRQRLRRDEPGLRAQTAERLRPARS